MEEEFVDSVQLIEFEKHLREEEKSKVTIEKYLRDVKRWMEFLADRKLDKELMLEYKELLGTRYAASSANSMIAAVNSFLRFKGLENLCVKQFRIQQKIYCPEEKELTREEYVRLVETARKKGNVRLSLMIQTICGTGIRISELKYITTEAVQKGQVVVNCKGKTRIVFLIPKLRMKLLLYIQNNKIRKGQVFVTKTGTPIDRSNIWKEMKQLCKDAKVIAKKVFPHNLRHLFARTFYEQEKDIAKLADILGHSSINTTRIYIMTTGVEHCRRMEQMRLII